MKSAEEILMHHAGQLWDEDKIDIQTLYGVYEAMKEYAKQSIEEQLKIAADEATVESETPIGKWHPEYSVDKDSIINCTRIELA